MSVWFVTGASRGFGLEIVKATLERGDQVVAAARDPRAVEKALPGHAANLLSVPLDVTDEAALPEMRRARRGRILNISSTGGVVAWPGWGVYSSTKFAVEGITEALRLEVAPLGIQVSSIQLGPMRTDFLSSTSLHSAEKIIEDYAGTGGAARSWAEENHGGQEGDPVKAAQAVLSLADRATLPARVPLGSSTVGDIRAKIAAVAQEVDELEALARSTDA